MQIDNPLSPPICLLFACISFLYSSVGHGGATGYLAVLSFFNLPAQQISTTALILNVMTASISLFFYWKAGCLRMGLTLPFIIASVPAAFLGSTFKLSENEYGLLLAIILFATAIKLIADTLKKDAATSELQAVKPIAAGFVGAVLGLVSGMVGIGGGVFLSPVILFLRWADAKQTAATAASFIVANSMAGLAGRFMGDGLMIGSLAPLLLFSLAGALAGSYFGAKKFSSNAIKRALAMVLLVAVSKLMLSR